MTNHKPRNKKLDCTTNPFAIVIIDSRSKVLLAILGEESLELLPREFEMRAIIDALRGRSVAYLRFGVCQGM